MRAVHPQAGDANPHQVHAQETQLPQPVQDERPHQGAVRACWTVALGAWFV